MDGVKIFKNSKLEEITDLKFDCRFPWKKSIFYRAESLLEEVDNLQSCSKSTRRNLYFTELKVDRKKLIFYGAESLLKEIDILQS
jgi:hypothetical protein